GGERVGEIADEALEIRRAPRAEEARGLGRLEAERRAQPFDERVGGIAREAAAQRVDGLEAGERSGIPAVDPLDARRGAGDRPGHRAQERLERSERTGVAAELRRERGKSRLPEREPGR